MIRQIFPKAKWELVSLNILMKGLADMHYRTAQCVDNEDTLLASTSVSAIVVTYRQEKDLRHCLGSLDGLPALSEIIVVNNEPGDGTREWVAQEFPRVRIIEDAPDDGYAGGINRGARQAKGSYLWILNPDTYIDRNALDAFLQAAATRPRALFTPKVLLPDGRINACGNTMHYTGITTCTGFGEPASAFNGMIPVSLLSGACIFVSRKIWEDLGGFNESFFLYMDDAELSLRARLKGYELWCVADAVIEHAYQLKLSSEKFYYLERNRLITILTVYRAATLFGLFPGLLLMEMATWAFALTKGPGFVRSQFRKYWWLWKQRHNILHRHQTLQESRIRMDAELLADMKYTVPYGQLVKHSGMSSLLTQLTTWIFFVVSPRIARKSWKRESTQ